MGWVGGVPLEPTHVHSGVPRPVRHSSLSISDDNPDGLSTADIIASQSQDYVDEKLAEYQATILQLQGE